MSTFNAGDLERLVESGCPACGARQLAFQTYVAQVLPIQGAEPVGKAKWTYDGEAFVDGVFEVKCGACKKTCFESSLCPACGAEDGLERALTTENSFVVPQECPSCGTTDLSYHAMVPAETTSDGKRTEKAKTSTAIEDPGFHGFRVDCRSCKTVAKLQGTCVLCGAASG